MPYKLIREEVKFSKTKEGLVGIAVGLEEFFLEVKIGRGYHLRVWDFNFGKPITRWVRVKSYQGFCRSEIGKQLERYFVNPKQVRKWIWEEIEEHKEGFPKVEDFDKLFKYFDEEGRFQPAWLAREIMKEHDFITFRDDESIYVYVDGCYRPEAEALIRQICKEKLKDEYRKSRASEVIDHIKTSTYVERREESPNLIPLKNGVLDLNSMELKPHSPDYMFFNLIPVKYDPKANCPNIIRFLHEITGNDGDLLKLIEWAGYCLYRGHFIHKALMLVGDGENGKSTFLRLVKAFLGKENVSGRSLQDLVENRFAKADLSHKLANIYADLPDRALRETGTFKMLTGEDLIHAEKKFRDSFTFENYAKLLFSANKVPDVYEDTRAFFRRWDIIVFPNVFTGDKKDEKILDKLTSEEELSGLLNLALEALKGLLKRGDFSYSKTVEEIRDDYRRKSSPIYAFVTDLLETDSDAFIEKQVLFNLFGFYCRVHNLPSVTSHTFFKNLPRFIPVRDFRPKIERKQIYCLRGIRIKSPESTFFKEISEKEAQNKAVSTLSNISIFFYSFNISKDEMEKMGYKVEDVDDQYIKVVVPKTLEKPKAPKRIEIEESPEFVWYYKQIKPSEKCKLCGKSPVEYLIETDYNTTLRRCESCFKELRKKFRKVKFVALQ